MKTQRRNRFTLIELLVVIAVVTTLAGMLLTVIVRARERSKQVTCINNVRNLSMAIQLFYNENQHYPLDEYLDVALKDYYNADEKAFECPSTHLPYDLFYVPRGKEETDNYFIGCPHHHIVNFGPGLGTQVVDVQPITWNGAAVEPGAEVGSGTITLADGSTLQVTGHALILTSFRRPRDNKLYTFLRIFTDYGPVSIHSKVTRGNRFEIVTPAAIAGVAGTEFDTSVTYPSPDEPQMEVVVQDGAVIVKGPDVPEPKKINKGQQWKHKGHKHKTHKKKNKKKNKKKK